MNECTYIATSQALSNRAYHFVADDLLDSFQVDSG